MIEYIEDSQNHKPKVRKPRVSPARAAKPPVEGKPDNSEETRQELKDRFVAYYRDVPVQKYAAMAIGRTEQTVINWLKEDEKFFNRVQVARADWVKRQVSKTRAEFKLERLEKEIFAPRQELTGPGGTNLFEGLDEQAAAAIIRAGTAAIAADTSGKPSSSAQQS